MCAATDAGVGVRAGSHLCTCSIEILSVPYPRFISQERRNGEAGAGGQASATSGHATHRGYHLARWMHTKYAANVHVCKVTNKGALPWRLRDKVK